MMYIALICVAEISVLALTFGSLVLYLYFKKQYKYWESKNVPCAKPVFPFGNLAGITDNPSCAILKKIYDQSKHLRFYGFWLFHKPVLMINDPDLIKRILVENFADFNSNGSSFDNGNDTLYTETLFSLEGSKWKKLRDDMSMIFSPEKLKPIFRLMVKSGRGLQEVLEESAKNKDAIGAKEFSTKFVMDALASTVFGIEINQIRNPYNEIGKMMYKVLKPGLIFELKVFIALYIPRLAKMLKLTFNSKEVQNFFLKLFSDIVDFREKNNISRNDVMQLLIELLKKGNVDRVNWGKEEADVDKFKFGNLVCQAMTFLVAGHETTTQSLQWALYELAVNPEIQTKLRKEIRTIIATRYNGEMTYEAIGEMEYLGRVVSEILRKYPVGGDVMRKCTKEFKDPCSNLIIDKNTNVFTLGFGLHWDERYYPNPEKFDPDRFTEENIASRPNYTYLPFGEGPRCCIGQTYALLLIKVGLIAILSNYQLEIRDLLLLSSIEFDPKSFTPAPKGEIMLKISHIS